MPIIETEIWKKNPDRPGTLIFDSQRKAQDVFDDLKAHLETDGRLPDEYFLFSANRNWGDGALFPKDAEIICGVDYGSSEGVYLDVSVKYEKEVPEYNEAAKAVERVQRTVTERFATGKTLGESIDDLDKMHLAASSVTAAFYGGKREIEERYAKIETGDIEPVFLSPEQRTAQVNEELAAESMQTVKTIYGDAAPGDWVIATNNNVYEYLIGTVTAIDKLGTPGHGTENETDDVHVDFTAFDYPPERIAEIEERFGAQYSEIALDDVIMPPKMLIRITHLGQDEIEFTGNLRHNCESFCNCFPNGVRPEGRHGELIARLEQNHEDYFDSLNAFGKGELIDMSDKITAMSGVFSYLTYRGFEDDELDFLLKFQDPLEVMAEGWLDYHQDAHDEMGYAFDAVMQHKQDWLDSHPLVGGEDAPEAAAESRKPPEKAGQADTKPKTLAEKMQAAQEKVKAQDAQNNNNKSRNREERE